jgi:hypothetical protein
MTNDRQEPLSSEDMIKRARGERTQSSDDLIEQAKESVSAVPDIAGLENIAIDIPVADRFPEPIPEIQTRRPLRVGRQQTQLPESPFSSDRGSRMAVAALAAIIMLIAVGVFVALAASAP